PTTPARHAALWACRSSANASTVTRRPSVSLSLPSAAGAAPTRVACKQSCSGCATERRRGPDHRPAATRVGNLSPRDQPGGATEEFCDAGLVASICDAAGLVRLGSRRRTLQVRAPAAAATGAVLSADRGRPAARPAALLHLRGRGSAGCDRLRPQPQ